METEQPPNSALDVKLNYISRDIAEIKLDMKEIKNDYIIRREFNEALGSLRDEIAPLKKFVYAIVGLLSLSVLGAILNLVIKK